VRIFRAEPEKLERACRDKFSVRHVIYHERLARVSPSIAGVWVMLSRDVMMFHPYVNLVRRFRAIRAPLKATFAFLLGRSCSFIKLL